MSVTHVAGPEIGIAGRGIQRCMWCGAKMCDSLGAMTPTNPDGSPPIFLFFGKGRLIQTDGNRMLDIGDFMEVKKLPADFCLDLVE